MTYRTAAHWNTYRGERDPSTDEALRLLSGGTLSYTRIATLTGLCPGRVAEIAHYHCLRGPHAEAKAKHPSKTAPKTVERDADIARLVNVDGVSFADVGEQYGLSGRTVADIARRARVAA